MAAELGLLSLTQLQKLSQSQQNQPPNPTAGTWMWNPKHQAAADQEADDSWEVRAFEEDTNNAMGTTWPPRSYTCTFCRREFRSAQALGGHMNVHRRDRARLHQTPPLPGSTTSASPATLIMNPTHHQELVANGGLCLVYSLPNPNGLFSPTTMNHCMESPYPTTPNLMPHNSCPPSINFPVGTPHSINNSSLCHSSNTERSGSTNNDNIINEDSPNSGPIKEELDLELRLGRGSSPY